jgi:hypothetical protein
VALGLHQACKDRLKQRLSECLPEMGLNNGNFLDRATLAGLADIDQTLPRQADLTARLQDFVSETPFFDFVYGELSKELHDFQAFDSESMTKRLVELPRYDDPEDLADRLVQSFDALPREYQFTFKLNRDISKHVQDDEVVISDSIRLIRPGENFADTFQLNSGIEVRDQWLHGGGLLSMGMPKKWDRECVYLQINRVGFVGAWIPTTPSDSSVSLLKSFLGTTLALRLLEIGGRYSSSNIKQRAYVHERTDDGWVVYESFELDEELTNAISNLAIDDLNGTLKSDKQKSAMITGRLPSIGHAFRDHPINDRVLLAAKWLLDSWVGRNELLAFVQATVALEILLGDKESSDAIGLGELLRNRCAYLIGSTHEQRAEILSEFKEIYDVRSKIVHRGKDRLNRVERKLLFKLRWMVNRVIQEEIERVGKNA